MKRLKTRRSRKKKKIKLILALILIVCIIVFLFTDSELRPILTNYSINQASIVVNKVINESVYNLLAEEGVEYDGICNIARTSNNVVSSIEINTVKVNMIKANIISKIQEMILEDKYIVISVPLGTVTGNEYLIGRGPNITTKMQMSAAVFSNIVSSLTSAGINQTLHQITMTVDTTVYLAMPWYRSSTVVSTSFVLAQTVIVGNVPDTFTNVVEAAGGNGIADTLFNYASGVQN